MAKSRKFSRPRKGKPRQLPPGTVTKESSCAVCRMRKLKCSGGRPACALCIKGAVAEGRLASGVRCLYSASSVHATAADKELEAMLGGRGSKCAWGEKVSVEAPPEGEPEEEEEEEEAGPSVVERALGPAPFAVYDVEDVDAAGENDPTFPPSSSVDSPPSSFPSTSTAPSTFYLPIPPALAHHIQSAPSLSVPSFPAFPTSAPTTTPRLELPKLGFAPPRARPPVVQPSAPRALRPVVAAAPVAGRSSAALGPPRPPAAPLAVEQEPFIMDDFALFRRTAFAPEPPYAEPASFDFFAPPPPPPPTSTQYHRDPAPARYVDAALSLAFPPAPYRSSYLGPTLHLDTALPSFYDDLPAAPYPAAHTLPHAFPSLMSSSATTGPPPALSGLAAAYLASTPLEPFAAVTAPSLLDGSSSGADAGFECGLGLDLGFEYAPPPPAQTQAQVHGEQLSARGSSATDAAAFFSMFRSDPWVGEQQQQGQGQGFEVGQWEGLGFGGWSG
ncbi:uncharacterized protein RHOBADRAFT_44685 [Rhodotorula graminis WP1]|uniref:Zn(2)-C6 fungal-type domain-containing protein n=1 Tax=Rhodotorula graminis (strain WP1) TaxID=578459 RepID=A0A194S455_RHOGW|nr:uncharacterized protein RHOBADRAFT_44685 [Rhodotorula graminis WP1]KPV74201.1 hypothetical protein RHOBADRAFT_44685 [Rhodotorula graminis WP1]